MNRRIIREPEREPLWLAVLVFLAVLAFVALLGVDDFETEPPRPNPWEMTE
jgi:hypothetical protein